MTRPNPQIVLSSFTFINGEEFSAPKNELLTVRFVVGNSAEILLGDNSVKLCYKIFTISFSRVRDCLEIFVFLDFSLGFDLRH